MGKIIINNFLCTFKLPPTSLIPLIYSIINFFYVSRGKALVVSREEDADMLKLKMKMRINLYYSSHKSLQIKKLLDFPYFIHSSETFFSCLLLDRRNKFNDVRKKVRGFVSFNSIHVFLLWYSYASHSCIWLFYSACHSRCKNSKDNFITVRHSFWIFLRFYVYLIDESACVNFFNEIKLLFVSMHLRWHVLSTL